MVLAAACLAGCQMPSSDRSPPEIGGIRVGMTLEEYKKVTTTPPGFRVGDVHAVYGGPQATFVNGRLVGFLWRFPTRSYETVKNVIRTRYPQLSCRIQEGTEVCAIGSALVLTKSPPHRLHSTLSLRRV